MARFRFLIVLVFLPLFIFGSEVSIEKEPLVDPFSLQPDWWSYYQVTGDILQERIEKTEEYFHKLQKENISSLSPEMTSLISEFLTNIKTYFSLMQKNTQFLSKKFIQKDSYPFKEWFQNARNLHENIKKLNDLESEYSSDKREIQKLNSEISNLYLKYLENKENTDDKALLGLLIMTKRSSFAINIENQKLHSTEILNQKRIVDENKRLVDISPEHLDFASISLEEINKNIREYNQRLLKIDERKMQIRSDLQKSLVDLSYADCKREIFEQQLLFQRVLSAQVEIEIINSSLIREIFFISKNVLGNEIKCIQDKIEGLTSKLSAIKNNLNNWAKSSQKELLRSIESLSTGKGEMGNYQLLLDESKNSLIRIQNIQADQFLSESLVKMSKSLLYLQNKSFTGWIAFQSENFTTYFGKIFSFFEKKLFFIGDIPVSLFGILRFFSIIFIFYLFGSKIQKSIRKYGHKQKKIQAAGIYTLSQLVFYLFLICGIFFAFASIGVSLTTFAFIAGALGIGIGFGLQSIFNNFISGILILLEKNIRIGDFLELDSGIVGEVIEINVRNTLVRSVDGIDVLVPNSEFITQQISNRTLLDKTRRIHVPFIVDYRTDKEVLKELLLKAVNEIPMTVKDVGKEAQLWPVKFAETGLELKLVVWINEYIPFKRDMGVNAYYLWLIHSVLVSNNIRIPCPHREVYMYKEAKEENVN